MKQKGTAPDAGDAAHSGTGRGYHHPELLQPGDITHVWREEWWAWDANAIAAVYQQHRAAVDVAAARAGVGEPWCVGAIAGERAPEAEATAPGVAFSRHANGSAAVFRCPK